MPPKKYLIHFRVIFLGVCMLHISIDETLYTKKKKKKKKRLRRWDTYLRYPVEVVPILFKKCAREIKEMRAAGNGGPVVT